MLHGFDLYLDIVGLVVFWALRTCIWAGGFSLFMWAVGWTKQDKWERVTGTGVRTEKISSHPVRIYIFIQYVFLFTEKYENETEAGSGVSRPYLRDSVFSRNNPILIPYL